VTPAGEYLIDRATKLVQHAERAQSLLRTVLDLVEDGHYDAMADVHLVRLPGETVRALRELLDSETGEVSP
jgi:DNA-binding transcriptional LysR family regulator